MPFASARVGLVSQVGDAIPDSGVAQWEFEESVNDVWFDNNLTDNTSAGYEPALASYGSFSKDFNSSQSDYLVANDSVFDFTDGVAQSLLGWVELDDVGSFTGLVSQWNATNGTTINYNSNNDEIQALLEDGGSATILGASLSSTNTTVHFALTKDASNNVKFYKDGGTPSETATTHSGSEPNNTYFGSRDGTTDYMDGQLDHVTVLDKEATQTEVQNHMDTGSI